MKAALKKIVVVCGPTGTGKTGVSVRLARQFNGEIVGADSMQVYRYMDIGTAKPTKAEQALVRHHMIDIIEPDVQFSAARFAEMASETIESLASKQILPFVTGGTGLYIRALVHGLFGDTPASPEIRDRLRAQLDDQGAEALHRRLAACDPASAGKIHPHDTFRVMRALEVFELTGKPISVFQQNHRFGDKPFDALKIGIHMEREALYERTDRRVDQMVSEGFVKEVEALLARGYAPSLKSMQAIGYQHVVAFLQARSTWPETLRTWKRDTRRYAKRQMTWFRKDGEIHWLGPDRIDEISGLIETFLAG